MNRWVGGLVGLIGGAFLLGALLLVMNRKVDAQWKNPIADNATAEGRQANRRRRCRCGCTWPTVC